MCVHSSKGVQVCVTERVKEVRGQPQMLSSLSIWFERGSLCCLPAEYTELADPILPTGALGLQMPLAQVYVGPRDSDAGSQTCTVSAFTRGTTFLFLVFFIYSLDQCIMKCTHQYSTSNIPLSPASFSSTIGS